MIRSISVALFSVLVGFFSIPVLRSQEPMPKRFPPAQQSEMNEKEIEHSKLYRQYQGRGDLRALATKSVGDVEVLNGTPQRLFRSKVPTVQSADVVSDVTRNADAIIIAVVNDQKSFLTAEGTFVFSDYNISVDQILKNNPAAPLSRLDSIIVTRPGGTVQLSNKQIRALDESLAPFEIGRSYLLFLEYIPTTGGYKAFTSAGAFRIESGKTSKLTKEQLPTELDNGVDVVVMMALIQKALH